VYPGKGEADDHRGDDGADPGADRTQADRAPDKASIPQMQATASPSWREVLPVHPAAELLPLMSECDPAGFKEFVDDIKTNGLREPVLIWVQADGGRVLLDGRNRLDALSSLGLLRIDDQGHLTLGLCSPVERYAHGEDVDPYSSILSLNVHRRHLTAKLKHDVIREVLKARPELSDRQIGRMVRADKNTIAGDRADLEARGEIHHVEKRTDAKGRKQPARRPKPTGRKNAPASKQSRSRTNHLDIIEVWDHAPPHERTKAVDGIGLKPLLAVLPEDWIPLIENWLADRRQLSASAVVLTNSDLAISHSPPKSEVTP
jgi:hypothetical protein